MEIRNGRRCRIVDTGHSTPCHIWTGAKTSAGYGAVSVGGKVLLVHRLTWEEVNDGLIPARHHIHHECEQKLCFNPEHLTLMTPKAHRRLTAKLTLEQALAIRESEETHRQAAERFGVSRSQVRKIRSGLSWA